MNDEGHNYFFGGWKEMPWKMKRDYINIDRYLDELAEDIYPQPPDKEHTRLAKAVIDNWAANLDVYDVLDVGCGEGFCQPFFEELGLIYKGYAIGEDVKKARELNRNVWEEDMHFIPDGDDAWDLIFVRHTLEHSPMPLLALMEWHRVGRKYLILILPKPRFWLFLGRNHYSVVTASQARFLLDRAGWKIMEEDHSHPWEYRFLCQKGIREFKPDEGYLWAYEHEDLTWLDVVEPYTEEEEVEEEMAVA